MTTATTTQLLAVIQNMETRFETLIDRYGITMDDGSHMVFLFNQARTITENAEPDRHPNIPTPADDLARRSIGARAWL